MAPKRQSIDLKTKVDIIKKSAKGSKQVNLTKEYGIDKSTISKILKDKDSIVKAFHDSRRNCSFKKLRPGKFEQVDKALITWFSYVRSQGLPINGPILSEKATQLAKELGIKNFSASSGYIDRFKKRHSISFKIASGESAAVDLNVVNEFKERLSILLQGYAEDDIYNMDETGLFYRMLPNKTMDFKKTDCHGGKQAKERMTVVVCTNMSGNDKRKLLVIGKSNKPRALKNSVSLPVTYKGNSKAWMTSAIFKDWIVEFDNEMNRKSRKVILFVDNCPSHPHIPNLSSISLIFLPPNTTAAIQPCDQGIIYSLKANYRKRLLCHLINQIDNGQKLNTIKIDIKQAIFFIYGAWKSVSASCARNSFIKCGFSQSSEAILSEPNEEGQDSFYDLNWPDFNFKDYVQADDHLSVSLMPTDDNIAEIVKDDCNIQSESDEDISVDDPLSIPSYAEACYAVETLKSYVSKKPQLSDTIFSSLCNVEDFINLQKNAQKKQSLITNFFESIINTMSYI